jgi:hypothetical protein
MLDLAAALAVEIETSLFSGRWVRGCGKVCGGYEATPRGPEPGREATLARLNG